MQAISQGVFGGPEVLELVEQPVPRPLPTEVLVRVHAIGVNPVEAAVRNGWFPLLGDPPFVLGWDISGVVEEATAGVTRFAVGDEVYGMPFFPRSAAGYAEYVVAPSRQLARKPRTLDHVHAAGVPLVGLTAWQALVDTAGVQAGQRVLIHGAGGGVGHLAVGIARALDAEVIGTASAGKHEFVRSLGAHEVIDHRTDDFTQRVRDVDVVVETIGGDHTRRSLDVLRPGGIVVYLTGPAPAELHEYARERGVRLVTMSVEPDYRALERLAELIDSGAVRPYVEQTWPLAEVVKAHSRLAEQPGVQGKLVLTV
jgi:NADPH:quinone reductase-like Zn-dependent oxidoreductase